MLKSDKIYLGAVIIRDGKVFMFVLNEANELVAVERPRVVVKH